MPQPEQTLQTALQAATPATLKLALSLEKWAEEAPPAGDLAGLPGELGVKTKADYVARLAEIRKSVEDAAEASRRHIRKDAG